MVSYSSLCIYWRWPKRLRKAQLVTVLCAGFLVHLSLGSIYTYGNLAPYIVSYVRNSSHPATLQYTDATFVFACQIAGQGLSMAFGGLLEKRFGPRLVSLLGGWFMSLGVLLSYFAIQKSFWLLLLTYGLMFGLGIGVAYIGPISCAMRWLPKWKGVATGIVVSGFGLSALIFNTVQTGFINPTNIEPKIVDETTNKYFTDPKLLDRVPYVFLILGGAFAVLQFVGAIFLANPVPPEEDIVANGYRQVPDNDLSEGRKRSESEDSVSLCDHSYRAPSIQREGLEGSGLLASNGHSSASQKKSSSNQNGRRRNSNSSSVVDSDLERSGSSWTSNYIYKVSPFHLLKQPNFYILWIMFMCVGISTSFISSLYKSYGLEQVTNDDHFLTIIGGVSSVFNLLGRLVWGALADVTSYKFTFVLQGALASSLLLTLYATSGVGVVAGKAMLFVWICGIFFCIGGYFSLFPTAIARSFGQENVSVNYGLLFTAQIVGGVLAAFISNLLVTRIYWYGVFFIMAGLNIFEYMLALCYRHKRLMRLRHPNDFHQSATVIEERSIKFPNESDLGEPMSD